MHFDVIILIQKQRKFLSNTTIHNSWCCHDHHNFFSFFCQLNSYDNQLLLPLALMLPVFVKSSSDFFYQIPDKHLLFEKTFSFQTFSIYSNTWRDHITSTRYMSKIPGSINKILYNCKDIILLKIFLGIQKYLE